MGEIVTIIMKKVYVMPYTQIFDFASECGFAGTTVPSQGGSTLGGLHDGGSENTDDWD